MKGLLPLRSSLALAAIFMGGFVSQASAVPNCRTCLTAYQGCVASGATNCETRYATCLAWCPDGASPANLPHAYNATSPSVTRTDIVLAEARQAAAKT